MVDALLGRDAALLGVAEMGGGGLPQRDEDVFRAGRDAVLERPFYGDGGEMAGVVIRGNGVGRHSGVGAWKRAHPTTWEMVGRLREMVSGDVVAGLPLRAVGIGRI